MKQILPFSGYTISVVSGYIQLNDFTGVQLERLVGIFDVTTGASLYDPAVPALSIGVTVGGPNANRIALTATGVGGLATVNDRLMVVYDENPTDLTYHANAAVVGIPGISDPVLVDGDNLFFRDGFSTGAALDATAWTTQANDASQTITQANSNLVIQGGTVANAVTTFVSKLNFSMPMRMRFALTLSQRIANQMIYVELVNPSGDTMASWIFDGTTATSAKIQTVRANFVDGPTTVTIPTTATTQIFEVDAKVDSILFNYRPGNSTAVSTTVAAKDLTILTNKENYNLRVRIINGATAPASNTVITFGFIMVEDNTKIITEVSGGHGNTTDAAHAIPVSVLNAITGTVTTVQAAPTTAGGYSRQRVTSAATTNDTLVLVGPRKLTGLKLFNTSASVKYLKLYNKATAPASTDTPVVVFPLPAGQLTQIGYDGVGVAYGLGLGYRITGAIADNDTTATAVNDVVGEIIYV